MQQHYSSNRAQPDPAEMELLLTSIYKQTARMLQQKKSLQDHIQATGNPDRGGIKQVHDEQVKIDAKLQSILSDLSDEQFTEGKRLRVPETLAQLDLLMQACRMGKPIPEAFMAPSLRYGSIAGHRNVQSTFSGHMRPAFAFSDLSIPDFKKKAVSTAGPRRGALTDIRVDADLQPKIGDLVAATASVSVAGSPTQSDHTALPETSSPVLSPPLDTYTPTGLVQQLSSCYLNSVLQLVYSLDPLRKKILASDANSLNAKHEWRNAAVEVRDALDQMDLRIHTTDSKDHLPTALRRFRAEICKALKLDAHGQQDTTEVLVALLSNVFPLLDGSLPELYQLRGGIHRTCLNCGQESSVDNTFNFLSIRADIDEAHASIAQIVQDNYMPGIGLDIQDSRCEDCNILSERPLMRTVSLLPPLLLLDVPRSLGPELKNHAIISYPRELVLRTDTATTKYGLRASTHHRGDQSKSGHVIAYVWSGSDVYKCNDKYITKVKEDDLEDILNSSEVHTIAYMKISESPASAHASNASTASKQPTPKPSLPASRTRVSLIDTSAHSPSSENYKGWKFTGDGVPPKETLSGRLAGSVPSQVSATGSKDAGWKTEDKTTAQTDGWEDLDKRKEPAPSGWASQAGSGAPPGTPTVPNNNNEGTGKPWATQKKRVTASDPTLYSGYSSHWSNAFAFIPWNERQSIKKRQELGINEKPTLRHPHSLMATADDSTGELTLEIVQNAYGHLEADPDSKADAIERVIADTNAEAARGEGKKDRRNLPAASADPDSAGPKDKQCQSNQCGALNFRNAEACRACGREF